MLIFELLTILSPQSLSQGLPRLLGGLWSHRFFFQLTRYTPPPGTGFVSQVI